MVFQMAPTHKEGKIRFSLGSNPYWHILDFLRVSWKIRIRRLLHIRYYYREKDFFSLAFTLKGQSLSQAIGTWAFFTSRFFSHTAFDSPKSMWYRKLIFIRFGDFIEMVFIDITGPCETIFGEEICTNRSISNTLLIMAVIIAVNMKLPGLVNTDTNWHGTVPWSTGSARNAFAASWSKSAYMLIRNIILGSGIPPRRKPSRSHSDCPRPSTLAAA